MTTTNNTVAQKNVTIVRLFVVMVLLMLSSNGAFAQAKEVTVAATTTEVTVAPANTIEVTAASAVASMDFAIWFVGTQKSASNATSKAASFSKKALINSGINTNSVLIRSILKKVSTQESSVA